MKILTAASLLVLSFQSVSAQTQVDYLFNLTADQVVPGPGQGQLAMSAGLSIVTAPSGPLLSFSVVSTDLIDITAIAIRGPASVTTNGPVLETVPFFQQGNTGTVVGTLTDLPITTATRDIIFSGQAYVEVRSLSFPGGALRGAVYDYSFLCLPQPEGSPTCVGCPIAPICGLCPCGNPPNRPFAGCRNSQGTSAQLVAGGLPALSADSLDFVVSGASSNSIALLVSGSNTLTLSSGVCAMGSGVTGGLTGGLRCVGGQVLRHGVQPTDINGATTPGAFTPPGGLLAQNGFMAGQTRVFQLIYSDPVGSPCGTGRNTSNAVSVTFAL